jgi:uncharacterized protein YggE
LPEARRSFAASDAAPFATLRVSRKVPIMNLQKNLFRPALAGMLFNLVAILQPGTGLAADAAPPRTLTVSGEGEAKAVPDEAHLSAGVVTQAKKVADALTANTRAMNAVFAALKRFGIPDKAIQTSEFSVEPQNAPNRDGNAVAKIIGYAVSNTVNVTVELSKLGPALDALVSSGANSLGNIVFTIHDPKPLLAKARADAIRDATERAQTYAKAGGFALGPILAVNEGGAPTLPMAGMPMRMAAAPMAPPPVAAGEETVSANVSVTFEIR